MRINITLSFPFAKILFLKLFTLTFYAVYQILEKANERYLLYCTLEHAKHKQITFLANKILHL